MLTLTYNFHSENLQKSNFRILQTVQIKRYNDLLTAMLAGKPKRRFAELTILELASCCSMVDMC